MKDTTLKQAFQVLQLIKDQRVPLEQLQKVIDSGMFSDLLIANVDEVDRQEFRRVLGLHQFEVWRTINLDLRFKEPEAIKDPAKVFKQALVKAGYKVSPWAIDLMSQPAFKQSLVEADLDREYELVKLTTAQLTGKSSEMSTTDEVFNGADRLGLDECQLWMAPVIRLDYKDQPKREWLRVGVKPFKVSDGVRGLFVVDSVSADCWLFSVYANPDDRWFPIDLWVFVRRN